MQTAGKAQYTPGPWHRDGNDIDFEYGREGERCSGTIASIYGRGEEQRANARLIAKAPEMAEALKAIVGGLQPPEFWENVRRILREAGVL